MQLLVESGCCYKITTTTATTTTTTTITTSTCVPILWVTVLTGNL